MNGLCIFKFKSWTAIALIIAQLMVANISVHASNPPANYIHDNVELSIFRVVKLARNYKDIIFAAGPVNQSSGITFTRIKEGEILTRIGLSNGDTILSFNETAINDTSDFFSALRQAYRARDLNPEILIERNGRKRLVSIEITLF